MSETTREEVMSQLRRRYLTAGPEHKAKLINQAVELFGYHRKSAIRALRRKSVFRQGPFVLGRPKEYEPQRLLKPLKAIWLAALQPCSKRLIAALPEWVPAYEQEHERLDSEVRQSLLSASAATLDRLLRPLRAAHRRRGATRPGTLLRQDIPIRTEWADEGAGYLEVDTVALCGGSLDDRHVWMFDGVDIRTTWVEMRAMPNRSQAATLDQLTDVEQHLPFALAGLDADNGGEFINYHVLAFAHQRARPLAFTRSRPYRKNDNAHVEQKNYTHVRQWFGYQRHDNPEVVPLINGLCKGPLRQLVNLFLPSMQLQTKRREGSRTVRVYGPAATPLARVLARPEVSPETKLELEQLRSTLNPFALRREIERKLKEIDQIRQVGA